MALDAGSLLVPFQLRMLVEKHLTIRNLEDAKAPVHVVATNHTGAHVCLSRGDAAEAVLASAAISVAFPPERIGNDHLMDGAIGGTPPSSSPPK
jgi:NTE family protein